MGRKPVIKQLDLLAHPFYGERNRLRNSYEGRYAYRHGKPEFNLPMREREFRGVDWDQTDELHFGRDVPEKSRVFVETIDPKRYAKAASRRLAQAVAEAKKDPSRVLVISVPPLSHSQYRRISKRAASPKTKMDAFPDSKRRQARLIAHAKRELGDRLVAVNQVDSFDFPRVLKTIARRGFSLSKNLRVRGFGEVSYRCVAGALSRVRDHWVEEGRMKPDYLIGSHPENIFRIGPKAKKGKLWIDTEKSGDTLSGVKAREIRKHTLQNYRAPKKNRKPPKPKKRG